MASSARSRFNGRAWPARRQVGGFAMALMVLALAGTAAATIATALAWRALGLHATEAPGMSTWTAWAILTVAAGAAALTVWALAGRALARRARTLALIQQALEAVGKGRDAAEELKLDARYGKAAELWNRLIDDREAARRTQQAQQAHDARRDRRRGGGGRLDELCDSLATGLILLDDQGKVTYCNGAGAVLLRTRREELVGAAVAGWIEEPRLLEGLQAALDSTQRRRTTVEVDRGEDQRGSVLRFTVRPARESDAARAVMIIEDITQQRVAEKARYAFVTHATHELRTPLTNIRLYVENLLDDPQADEAERCRCLNVINQEVRRLENLVGDMLSVAEIEAGAMRADRDDVPMGAIFEQLEHDYREQAADKKLTLRFDMPPKLPTLQGDRDKLVQALHNLVGNALKYTPEGGEVTVKAEWEDGRLLVDVIDSGIGISEADLPHLFQKFYRAKDERVSKITGSGLGLALSREIIRLHGGDITIESQINQGSTFSVSLPAPSQAA